MRKLFFPLPILYNYEFLQLVIILPRVPNKGSFGGIKRSVGLFFGVLVPKKVAEICGSPDDFASLNKPLK